MHIKILVMVLLILVELTTAMVAMVIIIVFNRDGCGGDGEYEDGDGDGNDDRCSVHYESCREDDTDDEDNRDLGCKNKRPKQCKLLSGSARARA